ncbi:MAG: GAF domain-containing protein [Anaerolineae bacterium]|nr:GAF domain-containing protein [Anaerolineae bacterium]
MDYQPIDILLVEDNAADARLLKEILTDAPPPPFQIRHAASLAQALAQLESQPFDVILLDLSLPPESRGLETLQKVNAQTDAVPIVVLTAFDDEESATRALQEGAQDYLVKGKVDSALLIRAIRYAIERKRNLEALKRRTQEMELLTRAAQELTSTLDLDEVLATILDEVRRLLGIVASSIWLLDRETDELVCQQASGTQKEVVLGWRMSKEEGIAGWVASHAESLIVADTRADSRHFKGVDLKTGLLLCSILSVPLMVKGEVIGVLQVVDTEPGRFNVDHLEVLEPLAASAAIAIDNARLFDVAQTEIAERKWVEDALAWEAGVNAVAAELSQALISMTSFEDISGLVMTRLRRLTGSTFGYTGYIDPATGYLACTTMTPEISQNCQIPGKEELTFETFKGLWGWVLEHREPLLTNDPVGDPRATGLPEGHIPIRQFLAVPAMIGDELVGQIALANPGRDYTDQDLELVLRLASLYALAVQRKHREITLQEREVQLRQRNEELTALNAISGTINQSLELDRILQGTLDMILEANVFNVNIGAVVLLADEQGRLSLVAQRNILPDHPCTAHPVDVGECLCGIAAQTGEIIVSNWQDENHSIRWPQMPAHQDICLPLKSRDRVLGVLSFWVPLDQKIAERDIALWQSIADQLSVAIENAQLFEEVRDSRDRLQTLSHRLVEVQETERRHIARELHDEVGQLLTGLKLVLEMSARQPADAIGSSLEEAQALVSELVTRVRDLSLDLRPAMLDDLGLLPALMWHFERYASLTNVAVDFKHAGIEGRRYSSEVETTVYRIVQEALTNVARHARVTAATVRLWDEAGHIVVQVEDAGEGFTPEALADARRSSGLSGMHERATLLGGQLSIESAPGGGTLLTAKLPLT